MRAHLRVNYHPCLIYFDTDTPSTQGTFEEINGIKTYVATPKVDHPKDKAILYLTDVFGLDFPNNRVSWCIAFSQASQLGLLTNPIQLLADDFARNGFKIYAPELFEGDPVAPNAFSTVCHPLFDFTDHCSCSQESHFRERLTSRCG